MSPKSYTRIILILIFLIIFKTHSVESLRIKFTKILCNETDKSFALLDICRIKAVSRDLQYFTLSIKWLQLPINEFSIRFRALKRANGYKPFLYDFTVNCNFIKHLNPLTRIVWGWIKKQSNTNHSCPITDDFKIERLENRYIEQELSALPVANGDYALFVEYFNSNITRLYLEIYVTFS